MSEPLLVWAYDEEDSAAFVKEATDYLQAGNHFYSGTPKQVLARVDHDNGFIEWLFDALCHLRAKNADSTRGTE